MASVLRGSGDSSFGGNLSIEGVLTYEDVASVDSIGVITARSGLHVGTGASISSPSSNTLTLGTNNEERLRITSDGKFGLGTTSPGRTLDVNGIIRADGTSGALAFGGNSSTPSEGVAIHRPANDTMALCTASTERVRIDSSGRLLLGTSSASGDALLQVNGPLQVQGLKIAEHSRSYTASTSAQDMFKIRFVTGHGAAELTWMFVDGAYPNGVRVGKIYLTFRGSGSNISAVSISSNTEDSITNGTVTGISWSASVHDVSHIKLTATGTATSGAGSMYIYGFSPYFDSLTPISDV